MYMNNYYGHDMIFAVLCPFPCAIIGHSTYIVLYRLVRQRYAEISIQLIQFFDSNYAKQIFVGKQKQENNLQKKSTSNKILGQIIDSKWGVNL